jgi:serine/threonine protein kinase
MTLAATPSLAAPTALDDSRLLPAGTRLDEFEILRPLGVGGFGIVYLALDHSLLRQVALKEFMPAELAARGAGGIVVPRSPDRAEQFERLLESFFNEARLLAPFNHPALVRVHRFWKANGTAYMAMQYCPGMTLMQVRDTMRGPPDEAWLRAVVEPILDALERLHHAGVFHRDISPDNILLLPNGRPILLDFGSARRAAGAGTRALTAVLKPNFAPIEQYGDSAGMAQGPWTDLYALGATVHFMLTGEVPTPAVMRVVNDRATPLAAAAARHFRAWERGSSRPSTGPRRSRRRIGRKASRRCARRSDRAHELPARSTRAGPRWGRRARVELALAAFAPSRGAAWRWSATTCLSAGAADARKREVATPVARVAPCDATARRIAARQAPPEQLPIARARRRRSRSARDHARRAARAATRRRATSAMPRLATPPARTKPVRTRPQRRRLAQSPPRSARRATSSPARSASAGSASGRRAPVTRVRRIATIEEQRQTRLDR